MHVQATAAASHTAIESDTAQVRPRRTGEWGSGGDPAKHPGTRTRRAPLVASNTTQGLPKTGTAARGARACQARRPASPPPPPLATAHCTARRCERGLAATRPAPCHATATTVVDMAASQTRAPPPSPPPPHRQTPWTPSWPSPRQARQRGRVHGARRHPSDWTLRG